MGVLERVLPQAQSAALPDASRRASRPVFLSSAGIARGLHAMVLLSGPDHLAWHWSPGPAGCRHGSESPAGCISLSLVLAHRVVGSVLRGLDEAAELYSSVLSSPRTTDRTRTHPLAGGFHPGFTSICPCLYRMPGPRGNRGSSRRPG